MAEPGEVFGLRVELGSDAMMHYDDIADALRMTAKKVIIQGGGNVPEAGALGAVVDLNGNTVGEWWVQ